MKRDYFTPIFDVPGSGPLWQSFAGCDVGLSHLRSSKTYAPHLGDDHEVLFIRIFFNISPQAGETRTRLDAVARFLDSAIHIPGTNIRLGADALLNLIPGVGTLTSKGMSAYLIWEARRLGVPTTTLLRMVGNVGLDFVISAVPIVGWVGDVFYRSNLRNMARLRKHFDRTHPASHHARP